MLNKLISDIAIAQQTGKGTAATAPSYVTPLAGSGYVAGVESKPVIDEETGQNYANNAYLDSISTGFDFTARAYPKIIGLFLKGILGSVVTTSATKTGFYKHVFTVDPTDTSLPWFTLWGNMGSEVVKTVDSQVDEMKISFEGNKPLDIAMTFAALTPKFGSDAARPTGGTSMAGLSYITPADLVFKIDVSGTTLASKSITKFSLDMKRNLTPESFSGSPLPGDISVGKFVAAPSATTKPDNLDDFKKAITGSASGTDVSTSVVTGSYSLDLTLGDMSLSIAATKVPWAVKWPQSDSAGGAVELEIAAENQLGTTSAGPITVTLINDVASY